MNAPAQRAEPWNRQQLFVVTGANAVGLVLLVVAWWGTRREADLAGQVSWLNLAVLAAVFASGTDLLWLANGRRNLIARRRGVLADAAVASTAAPVRHRSAADQLVTVPSGRRAHRADCALVAGKTARRVATDDASMVRCEVCRP